MGYHCDENEEEWKIEPCLKLEGLIKKADKKLEKLISRDLASNMSTLKYLLKAADTLEPHIETLLSTEVSNQNVGQLTADFDQLLIGYHNLTTSED